MNNILGNWTELVDKDVVRKLLISLDKEYSNKIVFPNKKEVFLPFKLCNYNNVKVVIMGMSPYSDGKATGIPFANREDSIKLSSSLELIKDKVEDDIYNGFHLDFDITLKSWIEQGVLLLNSALTVVRGSPDSHIQHWFNFNKELVKNLSNRYPDIIFCLWGKNAQLFERYINSNSIILKSYHPSYFARLNSKFECDHFKIINKILMEKNIEKIIW